MNERETAAPAATARPEEEVPAAETGGSPAAGSDTGTEASASPASPPAGQEKAAGMADQGGHGTRKPAATENDAAERGAPGGDKVVKGPGQANIDLVLRIPVKVEVVLGMARMTIAELMQLGPGAVVLLDRHVGEPIDVMVNGRLVARGEVVVDENDETRLGIRLTEIVEPGTFC